MKKNEHTEKIRTHTFTHHIPKEKEGLYYLVDFPVDTVYESMEIHYSYSKKTNGKENVVDFGLQNPNGKFLGWSGSSRQTIRVGEFSSTEGFYLCPIEAGNWNIIVGAYKIPSDGIDVEYTIHFYKNAPRWFVGDLHVHSNASDGEHNLFTLYEKAKKIGLDFLAIANHNNSAENLHLPKLSGLTLLPAVEWTHYKGHLNIFGVEEPFAEQFIINSEEEMLSFLRSMKEKGGILSVNHPFDEHCPWRFSNHEMFDMVEVWNSVMRESNLQAIRYWHERLTNGRPTVLVAGSDYHRDFHIAKLAQPVTWIYASTPSADDLLDGLRLGHAYVSSRASGIQLRLFCEDKIMGDTVPYKNSIKLHYEVLHAKKRHKIYLVNQTSEIQLSQPKGSIEVDETWKFAYLKVTVPIASKEYVRAISNPIYYNRITI